MIGSVNVGRVTEYEKNIYSLIVQDTIENLLKKIKSMGSRDWLKCIERPVIASRWAKEHECEELILSQGVNLRVIIRYGELRLISTLTSWLLIGLWRDKI